MFNLRQIKKRDINAVIKLPLSKSIVNRKLLINAIAGRFTDEDLTEVSSDSVILQKALNTKEGIVGFGDAGTPLRLYLAYAAVFKPGIQITGGERLKIRPIRPLLEALESLGAEFEYLESPYSLPLIVKQKVNTSKRELSIDPQLSSQFVSALMLIAPCFEKGLHIFLSSQSGSADYIGLTAECMKKSGVPVVMEDLAINIEHGRYIPDKIKTEADWSAAGFIYAWLALSASGSVRLPGLSAESAQGDAKTAKIFESFGIRTVDESGILTLRKINSDCTKFELNVKDTPDIFPVMLALCAVKQIPALFTGIANLRLKESDRIQAMDDNLRSCGIQLDLNGNDSLSIRNSELRNGPFHFRSFNDHRIAMALSLFAFKTDISIDKADVVKKSFPQYWELFNQTLYSH